MSDDAGSSPIVYRLSPDHPGWHEWYMPERDRFNPLMGTILVRDAAVDDPAIAAGAMARVRMVPTRAHSNYRNDLHGGALLAFVDIALFAGAQQLGIPTAGSGVTVDLQAQMVGPGRLDEPLDALIEVVREGGRLVFLRGLVEQAGGHRVAAFSGVIKKMGRA